MAYRHFNRFEWLNQDLSKVDKQELDLLVRQNQMIDLMQHDKWLANIETNLPIAKTQTRLTRKWNKRDGQCLVCGAGPSLYSHLPDINLAQSDYNFYVIATDRAVKPLINYGIIPDMIITIDAAPHILDFFEGVELPKGTKVAVCLHTDPKVVQYFINQKCKLYFYYVINPFSFTASQVLQKYGDRWAMLRTGLTVSFSAVDMAYWMGFTGIFTIGNDLAFLNYEDAKKHIVKFPDTIIPVNSKTHPFTINYFAQAAWAMRMFPMLHGNEAAFIDVSGGLLKHKWQHGEFRLTYKVNPVNSLYNQIDYRYIYNKQPIKTAAGAGV